MTLKIETFDGVSVVQIPSHLRKEESTISAAEPDYQELPLEAAAADEQLLDQIELSENLLTTEKTSTELETSTEVDISTTTLRNVLSQGLDH